jgi:hypothetical protein
VFERGRRLRSPGVAVDNLPIMLGREYISNHRSLDRNPIVLCGEYNKDVKHP